MVVPGHSARDGRPARAPAAARCRASGAFLALVCLAGCGTVEFEAPPGSRVRILRQSEPAAVQLEQKIWYAGWGQWPLCNNSTAPLIADNGLVEVRMATDQTFLDNLISSFTSIFSFSVRTLYVEGNSAPPTFPADGAAREQVVPGASGT